MVVTSDKDDTRSRIVEAAARLLHEHGPAAVTTRGVATDAGVQAPTIYRLFGDKDGLLEAVAEHVMATFVEAKAVTLATATSEEVDPLADLRTGWSTQIEFGLANPTLFRLLNDPDRVRESAAARSGKQILAARIHRVALSGRLRVTPQRAVDIVHAAGTGTIQSLLATQPDERDPGLADAMLEAALVQILADADDHPSDTHRDNQMAAVVTLRAATAQLDVLSEAERHLFAEWLDRIAGATTRRHDHRR